MRRFNRTTLITVFCLAVLVGIGLARKYTAGFPEWLLVFWPVLLLLKRRTTFALVMVVIFGLGLGLWRGGLFYGKALELKSLTAKEVTVYATANLDSIYGKRSQIEFTAGKVELTRPYAKSLAGSFKISGFGEHMIYRGDRVRVSGKLFPTRGSNQATIAYGQITRLKEGHSFFAGLTRRFAAGMQNALPEPLASFAMGLLIGQRVTMPQNILDQLTAVGLVHIVAVSGYNLIILVRGVGRLKLRSKYQKNHVVSGLNFTVRGGHRL